LAKEVKSVERELTDILNMNRGKCGFCGKKYLNFTLHNQWINLLYWYYWFYICHLVYESSCVVFLIVNI